MVPTAAAVAMATVLIGAAGAPAADPEPFAGSDDIQIDGAGLRSAQQPGPEAAQGLSSRLTDLSSARLDDASRRRQADAVSLPATGEASLQRAGGKLNVQARVEETSSGDPRPAAGRGSRDRVRQLRVRHG